MHTRAKELIREEIKKISAENRELRQEFNITVGADKRASLSHMMRKNQLEIDRLIMSLEVLNGGTLG